MAHALETLLGEIVDYAGLFPPATLPLADAIRNYAEYRKSNETWMLGRFIIPIAKLGDLDPHASLFDTDPPFRFSGLGRGGVNVDEFVRGFAADLADIHEFEQRHAGKVTVDAFEVKLPAGLLEAGVDVVLGTLDSMVAEFDRASVRRLRVALEVPIDAEWWTQRADAVLDGVRAANEAMGDPSVHDDEGFGPFLLKLRLGGVTADAFPDVEAVATAIIAARDRGVPLKLTAGLHHPIRHRDPATGAMMHGFLNVYVAGVMAVVHALDVDEVSVIIADESPDRFQVTADVLAWGSYAATNRDIAAVRRTGLTSYGSCSFDEPREDLAALGLLPTYSKP